MGNFTLPRGFVIHNDFGDGLKFYMLKHEMWSSSPLNRDDFEEVEKDNFKEMYLKLSQEAEGK